MRYSIQFFGLLRPVNRSTLAFCRTSFHKWHHARRCHVIFKHFIIYNGAISNAIVIAAQPAPKNYRSFDRLQRRILSTQYALRVSDGPGLLCHGPYYFFRYEPNSIRLEIIFRLYYSLRGYGDAADAKRVNDRRYERGANFAVVAFIRYVVDADARRTTYHKRVVCP